MLDGNWVDVLSLPPATGRTGGLTFHGGASWVTQIETTNTDLGQPIRVPVGHQLHFYASGGLWRWSPVPVYPATPIAGSYDFWRSNAGTLVPNGTTDTSEFVSRPGAVGIGSNTQVGTSQLSVVSDSNTVTDPIISAQASNLTRGVDIVWGGVTASGTAANSDLGIIAKGTGHVVLQGAVNGMTAATGNVGVNIAAPTAKLHVNGANANGGAVPLFRITDTNIAGSYLGVDNGVAANTYRLIANATSLEFQSGGNGNQLVLAANGGVGVGTNAPTAGAGNLSVNANGFKPAGGAWGAFSDLRIKRDVKPFVRGLKELLALNPISYSYNGKAGSVDDEKTYVSLIAQEVKEVLPEFVESQPIAEEVYAAMSKADKALFADKEVLVL
ncbi:MAG: tail fiber domain-containing protein, partial [Plesiomonas shigelloides]